MRKRYFFIVCINGMGKTREEAWKSAVEHFHESPEDPPENEDPTLLDKIEMIDPPSDHMTEIECYAKEEEES